MASSRIISTSEREKFSRVRSGLTNFSLDTRLFDKCSAEHLHPKTPTGRSQRPVEDRSSYGSYGFKFTGGLLVLGFCGAGVTVGARPGMIVVVGPDGVGLGVCDGNTGATVGACVFDEPSVGNWLTDSALLWSSMH
jgi:hypothetical protein